MLSSVKFPGRRCQVGVFQVPSPRWCLPGRSGVDCQHQCCLPLLIALPHHETASSSCQFNGQQTWQSKVRVTDRARTTNSWSELEVGSQLGCTTQPPRDTHPTTHRFHYPQHHPELLVTHSLVVPHLVNHRQVNNPGLLS